MSKMIQIRNVPDDLHRRLKVRAAMEGMSLSDYLLSEIRGLTERPTLREVLDRLHREEPLELRESSAHIVRALRGE
jgi:antitoxin FitA